MTIKPVERLYAVLLGIAFVFTAIIGLLSVNTYQGCNSYKDSFVSEEASLEKATYPRGHLLSADLYRLYALGTTVDPEEQGNDTKEKEEADEEEDLGIDRTWSVVQFAMVVEGSRYERSKGVVDTNNIAWQTKVSL